MKPERLIAMAGIRNQVALRSRTDTAPGSFSLARTVPQSLAVGRGSPASHREWLTTRKELPMLSVTGIVTVRDPPNHREFSTESGKFIEFDVVSDDPLACRDRRKQAKHVHRAVLWVRTEDVAEWRAKLAPGAVFYISAGTLAMKERETLKHPIPELRLDRERFHPLAACCSEKAVAANGSNGQPIGESQPLAPKVPTGGGPTQGAPPARKSVVPF